MNQCFAVLLEIILDVKWHGQEMGDVVVLMNINFAFFVKFVYLVNKVQILVVSLG